MATSEGAPAKGAFGRLLRQKREHAGLRQERLAERAGLSVPAISNLERGVNRPRLETVNLLAEALALPAEQRAALLAAALHEPPATPPVAPQHGRPAAGSAVPSALAPARHNLPVPATALVGREREVATVQGRMQAPDVRLLTLTGVGGVGKTRVALAVGAALVDQYADGVWLVELAPLADPALVLSAVAGVLGLREEAAQPLSTTLVTHLRDRQLLLVLDNCEHLLEACATLASTLLRACPRVRILATSRAGLGVSGEQIRQVPPLSVPDPRHRPPLEWVGSYEAVRLFVARAQARQPDFALGEHNASAVATICERLDGIPLALELAAARMGSLPVEAIAARLGERFHLLTQGPRDVLPRQQTLQATMMWSWDLLEEQEQMLLRRLSVFAGGATLEAVEAVCSGAGVEKGAVLDLLDGLANKSLLTLDAATAEARYGLLETVRHFAGERLDSAGESDAVRQRHLNWCVALAQAAARRLLGTEQGVWLTRLDQEHANLRAALHWARVQGETVQGMRLAGALWRFWSMRGYLGEGRGWLETALAGDHGASAASATVLEGAGVLAFEQGDYGRAAAMHEEALAQRRALGDRAGIAASLNGLGNVASVQGDYVRATALHEAALAQRRELGDRAGIASSLNGLGILADLRGEYARAAALHEEALAQQRVLGDRQAIAKSLINRGIVAKKQGDYGRATALYEEGLALQRAMGDKYGVAASLNNLGIVAKKQGDYRRAVELFKDSLALGRELGDIKGIAVSLDGLGIVACLQGDYGQATALHEEALARRRELGDRAGIAASLNGLGIVAYLRGEYARATALLEESLLLGREIGARDLVAEALESLAWVVAARAQPYRALRFGGAAEALRQVLGVSLMPEHQADHERAVHAVRATLGEEVFAATWAEGREMTHDEAIALALESGPTG